MTKSRYTLLLFIATIAVIPYHASALELPLHDKASSPVKTTYWEEKIATKRDQQDDSVT